MPNLKNDLVIETVQLSDLKLDQENARLHPDKNLHAIQVSLERFGQVEPLVVQRGTNKVIGGNGRLTAMRAIGWHTAKVVRIDVQDHESVSLALALNRSSDLAEWDSSLLEKQIQELTQKGVDTSYLNIEFDAAGILLSLDDLNTSSDPSTNRQSNNDGDDDQVNTDAPKTTNIAKGDMYILDGHRVICEDSFNIKTLNKLIGSSVVDIVFTDPPYGMDVDTEFSKMHKPSVGNGGNDYARVIGDDQAYDPLFLLDYFKAAKDVILFGADYFCQTLPTNGSWYCWDKRCADNFDRLIGNGFELAWSKKRHKKEVARFLWAGHQGLQQEDSGKRLHPTQKPLALIRWFFDRLSGDVVIDPFAGSGSTLIACEQTGRRCLAAEIDPIYCQVIIDRWEKLTGKTAVRHSANP